MAYEELDSWVDANAPNLNKDVLHTLITDGESKLDYETCTISVVNTFDSGVDRFYFSGIEKGAITPKGYVLMHNSTVVADSVLKNCVVTIITKEEADFNTNGMTAYAVGSNFICLKGENGQITVSPKTQTNLLGSSSSIVFNDEDILQ